MQKITSAFLSLNESDLLKGLLMTVGGAAWAVIAPSVENKTFVFNWTEVWHTAVAAGVVYLVKNLLTPAKAVKTIEKV